MSTTASASAMYVIAFFVIVSARCAAITDGTFVCEDSANMIIKIGVRLKVLLRDFFSILIGQEKARELQGVSMVKAILRREVVFLTFVDDFVIVCVHDFLPVLVAEVSFPLAERFDFLSLFVDLPLDDLSRLILFVTEPVVAARDRVIIPRVATFKVEGANVANELYVVVVEATHPRQILEAVDLSFGEFVFYFFHVYKVTQNSQKARDFFTINETFFVDKHPPHF